MYLLNSLFSQKRILLATPFKINSVLTHLKPYEKLSFISVRFCHSELINSSRKNKVYSFEMHKKPFTSGKMFSAYEKSLHLGDLTEADLFLVVERFGMQGLDVNNLIQFEVKVTLDLKSLLLPLSSLDEKCSALQIIEYNKDKNSHFFFESDKPVLFGWSQLSAHDKILIVTSHPFDAIAVRQSTNLAAVSLPVSDLLSYSYPPEVLTLFTTFDKVIFWMKADLYNFKTYRILDKILVKRGFVVLPEYKNPLFCLQNNLNIKEILEKACVIHDIKTINSYKDVIRQKYCGAKAFPGMEWKRFSPLNAILKGHRNGELTVITGHAGTIKTAFLCEYTLDLCIQGVETLYFSLEVNVARTLCTMLSQFSRCPLKTIAENIDYWIDKFDDELPMVIFMPKFSSSDEEFNAMKSSVTAYNIKHIVIDNLQFMRYLEDNSVLDELQRQDQTLAALQDFSKSYNCHITVFVNPRKEQEFFDLTTASTFATAKTIQESDNLIFLETRETVPYLEVLKNCFDGDKGRVLLEFDKCTNTFIMKNNH